MDEQLIQTVTAKAKTWLGEEYDAETRAAVQAMLDNEDKTDLIESFYRDLEFGTGGLRGIMGAGSNRMNIYTVGAATQGLSNYLNKSFAGLPQISVAIGHDCRNNSRRFAEISADIFSANGIKVYLFEDLRPTPEMSFAIRKLGCQSGIILTASHNPKEYNGYKAYWDDGGQIITPHDTNIIDEVNLVKTKDIKFKGNKDLIQIIGKEIDEDFINRIKTLSLSPDSIKRHNDLKIVYTPIHGTGVKIIPACLRAFGFTNIIPVPEQNVVSGDFPTVISPNPEEPAALSMAIEKAKETDADIVMASDPDADRMGIAVKNDRGEWILVNGNQTALLFIYYLITRWKETGKLKGNEYIVKTIVTTELIKTIADRNKVELFDCYTGFKWIAAVIHEQEGKKQYIGGGEESYGFLVEDFVRDKDAVSSCAMMAEIAAWAKDLGKTLYQLMTDIYVEYGFSKEKGVSVVKKGKSGAEEIQQMMKNFSANPPKEIAGSPVVLIKDFNTLEAVEPISGKKYKLEMPTTSNVLQYFSKDGSKVSIRPSGTEPKIKFYIEVRGTMNNRGEYDRATETAEVKVEAVMKSLGL
ncbi:MAG: phospho-sugar mutase [Bacteroidales bacterium]|nr:phospho-sugar mutase [Bacteroidales bacterium]MDD2611448.1 phospho-sugar mutase [Bacteroidales bacterium]MDD3906871.1 phospho-sugar mutase [Bacteroidales bacterium]MDD4712052.1 phospho-sugar mutase [Bacteroidales bacterium]